MLEEKATSLYERFDIDLYHELLKEDPNNKFQLSPENKLQLSGYQLILPTEIKPEDYIHLLNGALQNSESSKEIDEYIAIVIGRIPEEELLFYLYQDLYGQASNRYWLAEEIIAQAKPKLSSESLRRLFLKALRRPYIPNSDGSLNEDNLDYIEVLIEEMPVEQQEGAISIYLREGSPTVEGTKLLLDYTAPTLVPTLIEELSKRSDVPEASAIIELLNEFAATGSEFDSGSSFSEDSE
jgi:hypothetical protein